MKIQLAAGHLYLFAGLPASGKGTFLSNNNVPDAQVISPDRLRQQVLGVVTRAVGDTLIEEPSYANDPLIWDVAKKMLEARMKEHLTTFFDATLVTEKSRNDVAKIARAHNVPVTVLFFDVPVDTCIARDKKRRQQVGEKCILAMAETLSQDSVYPIIHVSSETRFDLTLKSLPHNKIDLIGDLDGLLDEMVAFLDSDFDYTLNSQGILVHRTDPTRRVLFMGDFIDRGVRSLATLQFVAKQVKAGHFAIIGNHENKLMRFVQDLRAGQPRELPRAPALTAMEFVTLPEKEQNELLLFLQQLPAYYVQGRYAFVHADIRHFDPLTTPRSFMVYGDQRQQWARGTTPDTEYSQGVEAGVNAYTLFRGHTPQEGTASHAISLDGQAAFKGQLKGLGLDAYDNAFKALPASSSASFVVPAALDKLIKTVDITFDFNAHYETHYPLHFQMKKLVKDKMGTVKTDETGLLNIYKYSKKVFYDQSWAENTMLLKCRGLVLDMAGNIVQHPFDKIFNYGEPNELRVETAKTLSDDTPVVSVEKENGFLGCVTKHPLFNQLLCTTTGSFASDFVGYIEQSIKAGGHYGNLMRFFNQRPDLSLMFEVIHSDDPHIIPYKDEDKGIYLIGVRGKYHSDVVWTEEAMDDLAKTLGLRRPPFEYTTLGALKKKVAQSEIEGYMVRLTDDQQSYVCKFKTPHYLTRKFLARMGKKNIQFMFKNPDAFKQKVDEEFFPLVDALHEAFTEQDYTALTEQEKLTWMRKTIAALQS
jgi:predicted kinase